MNDPQAGGWRTSTLVSFLIGYIGFYLCRANLSAAFPAMADDLKFSNAQLGLIAFYSELAYAAGKIINGPLGDMIGGRRIFLLGMAGAAACNLAFAFGSTIPYFVAAWCACRYFLSMGWGGISKTIGGWYPPERRGTVMGLMSTSFQLGGAAAALFCGFLLSRGAGWRELFLWPGAVVAAMWAAAFLASKEAPVNLAASKSGPPSSLADLLRELMRQPLLPHLLAFSVLATVLRSVFIIWSPMVLVSAGLSRSSAAYGSAVFEILGCVSIAALGWYSDLPSQRGDRARPMVVLLSGLALCLVWLAFFSGSAGGRSLALMIGLCGLLLLGPYSMASGALSLEVAGVAAASSAAGLIDGVGYFGGALGIWAAGAVADRFGWKGVFLMLSAVAVLSAVSALMLSLGFRRRSAVKEKAPLELPNEAVPALSGR